MIPKLRKISQHFPQTHILLCLIFDLIYMVDELLEPRGKFCWRLIVGSSVFLQFAGGSQLSYCSTFWIKRLSIELFPAYHCCHVETHFDPASLLHSVLQTRLKEGFHGIISE